MLLFYAIIGPVLCSWVWVDRACARFFIARARVMQLSSSLVWIKVGYTVALFISLMLDDLFDDTIVFKIISVFFKGSVTLVLSNLLWMFGKYRELWWGIGDKGLIVESVLKLTFSDLWLSFRVLYFVILNCVKYCC